MLNIRIASLSVAFVVIGVLTAGFVTFKTGVVSAPASDPARVLENQARPANQQKVENLRSYRSHLDECFDVSLRELANCRNASQSLAPSYRSHLDECFDVSLMERNSCQNASQTLAPSYRSRLGECFDVPLRERSSCRNASPIPVP